ncbi:MAG: ATP-binding protein, partial [Roseimicrobium sp.]
RAEEALRSNELRLRAIFSQASTLIGIVSPDGILLDGNDAALAAANVRLDDVKGRPYWETSWWNRDAKVQVRIRSAIELALRGQASHFETTYFASGGRARWGDVHVTPVTDAGKLAFILVEARDITELNEARTALVQARDGAERASQAKDDFLASLSHELRTPLNPVLLLATEAARNTAFPKEAREDFDTIAKNVMLEARLIDDLLDLTLITRGKMPLDMGLRDAHEIVRDAVSTVNMEMDNKSIALTLRLAAQEHQVWGDAVRLQQIFWNVLKNAVKFTPSGGSITLSTRNTGPDHDLLIEISDSGIGMTGEELARVFDYFSQGEHADSGGSHRFGGLGLGLAISRMLVEMHAGSIQASSKGRNQGTTITLRLATTKMTASGRVPIPREFREAVPVIVVEDDEMPSNMRILLVEDHEPTRVALAQLLKRRKHQVTTAGTVAEALAAAESDTFDLVMSDIGLPDGNGNDLMRELRSRYKLRGIALTGYGMSEDIARTHAAGFMAHLTKPISVQSLDQALLMAQDRIG